MKLKVTFRRPAGSVDLSITADATASVADVAAQLAASDPGSSGAGVPSGLTLRSSAGPARDALSRLLNGEVGILDSGIRSGSVIELAQAFPGGDRKQDAAAAVLRVLAGADAGREFPLPSGSSVVGRDRSVDVRLSDPLISKRHARITVGDQVEIIDLNSANGVFVSGDQVTRAALTASDAVTLGDTVMSVVRVQGDSSAQGAVVEQVRSPRVVPRYPGRKVATPKPPALPQPMRFPMVAMAAPLVMGAVIYAVSPSVSSVLMMAMSPLLMIGAWADQRMTARRALRKQKKQFDEGMLRVQEELEQERATEQRVRRLEAPALAELEHAVERLGPLVWTTRPEHSSFLCLNLGTGRAASRNEIVVPDNNETFPEYWEQLQQLKAEFSSIDEVPIVIDLRRDGSLGVAGPRQHAADVARGLVMQAATLHSPAEVVFAAVVSQASRTDWEWLKWLPHSSSAHSPLAGEHLADGPTNASGLLAQLEGLIEQRVERKPTRLRGPVGVGPQTDERAAAPIPAVLVVVETDAPVDRGRLTRLAERGPDAGVHVIWVAPSTAQLPAACRSFVQLDNTAAGGLAGIVRLGDQVHPLQPNALVGERADALARQLAPVVDVGVPEEDDSDLPRQVSYANLAGLEILDSTDYVIDRWRANNSLIARDGSAPARRRKEANLRALVGHAGAAPLFLDLRRDGPHALVGGTTGAGKSEFLQSWVLGMAAANSPDRLTFLFVDYKGGAAFADCVKLPHTVGLVTDLSPHLVRRALTSLRAELRYREHVLQRKKAKDLLSLERTGDPECPPSLVIIVDEFAALVQEVPEFVDGVVDVAQRGRSLGLHLILATQRPAGVIKENLRANTNLRVALRMADTDDSVDILGDPMAAHFDPSTPGRGAAKTGPGRIQTFQAGYAGGWTTSEPPKPRIDVAELGFGVGATWEPPEAEEATPSAPGPTDIARIVANLRASAAAAEVPEPRKPWLAELAPIYSFSRLPNPRTDEKLPLGVLDHPESQSQPTIFYEPDRDGNLAVLGTGGSGKSTVLRTIAVAAAATTRNGGPTHVYGLDFGSRGLHMLEELPHVGAIVSGDDEERVVRTIRMLRDIVDERAVRYSALRAGSISEYRHLANSPGEPRILLLVDAIGVFKEQYEFGPANLSQWFTAFAQVAADGRSVGVHVVMTGDRPNSIPATIASTVQRRIVLRMANEDEYLNLGVPRDVLSSTSPPGRGIIDDHELQVAILGESGNVAVQARELQRLAESLNRSQTIRPVSVRRLAEQISLDDLPNGAAGNPTIGIEDVSLGPLSLPATGTLMVAGPPGSGRTTALLTLSASLRRSDADVRQILLTPRRSVLPRRAWQRSAEGVDAVADLARSLAEEIERGDQGRSAIFIESIAEFAGTDAEYELDRLVKVAAREEHFVVGESETSSWLQAYGLAGPFKAGRRGLLLVPGELDGDSLLGISLGRLRRADFPPGRGFLVSGGRAIKVQIAQG
jgi:S-DNA-T family DNA segregation ATPase FtsK/SpoIIIE